MKRLVLCVIALLAIFAVIRAYTQSAGAPPRGATLSPGLIEVAEDQGSVSVAFGLMGTGADGKWNILPLRISYTSGGRTVTLSMNGFSFLLAQGIRIGQPVVIGRPVGGDVVSIGGKVTVNARVAGDVWAFGADIALGAGADVTGNVVSIGGKVAAAPGARVGGGIHSLPELKLPFVSFLGTPSSASIVELIRELLGFALGAAALFLLVYFMGSTASGIARAAEAEWRRSLISLVIAVVGIPLLAVLLVISVFGIFFLPFLLLAVLLAAFSGFLSVSIRLGSWMRRDSKDTPLFLFTSGLLGYFLIKCPAFAGILLGLIRSPIVGSIGQILRIVSQGLSLALLAYGFGSCLSYLRTNAISKKG
jgi:hypothetical protein